MFYSAGMSQTAAHSPATPTHYDRRTITLHWVSAALVLLLWLAGQSIDWFPKGAPRMTVRSLHICCGLVLGLLLVARIAWRHKGGVRLAPAETGARGKLATGIHHLLYALLAATVLVGVACVWIRGDTLFNLLTVPAFDPGNKALRHDATELHELLANLLLGLAALHAAVALWHQHLLKDDLLRRMWPSLPAKRAGP